MRFKTENLYLVKISKIAKIEEMSDKIRRYYDADVTGISTVVEAEPVITNTEYLTEEEALRILKELNPTYLKENTKRLRLFK